MGPTRVGQPAMSVRSSVRRRGAIRVHDKGEGSSAPVRAGLPARHHKFVSRPSYLASQLAIGIGIGIVVSVFIHAIATPLAAVAAQGLSLAELSRSSLSLVRVASSFWFPLRRRPLFPSLPCFALAQESSATPGLVATALVDVAVASISSRAAKAGGLYGGELEHHDDARQEPLEEIETFLV